MKKIIIAILVCLSLFVTLISCQKQNTSSNESKQVLSSLDESEEENINDEVFEENNGLQEKEGFIQTESGHWVVDQNKSKIDKYEPNYSRHVFYSEALGISRNYIVYLPEGYDDDEELSYPVLYLLRASEGELPEYAIDAYEKVLNEGKVGPMILVFPNTGNGVAVNYFEPSPSFGKSQFEDYFIKDLIPYIDSNYRTIDSKYARAIDGFSIGGFSALFLAMKHVDLFSSVGSFDGTLTPPDYSGFFSGYDRYAFGFPLDKEHYSKNNPSNLMRDGDPSDLKTINYYIQASASNLGLNRDFIDLMGEQAIENGLNTYVLGNSDHTFFDMGRHLEMTMPLHYEGFKIYD